MQIAKFYASSARMKASTWPRLLPETSFLRTWPHDVDGGGIELRLQMGRIVFLNSPYACPTISGDLIDVGAFEQAQANVCVAQAISCSRPAVAVDAELFFIKNCIE